MLLRLEPTQAHIWYLPSQERTAAYLRYNANRLISPEEFVHSRRFLSRPAGDSYLTARAFVRAVLSQYIDASLQSWHFRPNPYGKPEVEYPMAGRSLRFNVAYTDVLVTCVVALGRATGIDVEEIDNEIEMDEIADRYFAPTEAAALRKLPPDKRPHRFFELWTLKEAYVKARGLGLSLPFKSFSFGFERKWSIDLGLGLSFVDNPADWHFSILQPVKSHLIAIALARLPTEDRGGWQSAIELVTRPFDRTAFERAMQTLAIDKTAHSYNLAMPAEYSRLGASPAVQLGAADRATSQGSFK